jgi:fluoride exporter
MLHLLIVGVGGFIGSIMRYALSGFAQRWTQSLFPLGTLAVNLTGCLMIGVIWSLVEHREWFSPETRLFITVGVLGGFTTFSAFGFETFVLLRDGQFGWAAANVAANVFFCIGAVMFGWMLTKAIGGSV